MAPASSSNSTTRTSTQPGNYAAHAVPEQPDSAQPHQSAGEDALCRDAAAANRRQSAGQFEFQCGEQHDPDGSEHRPSAWITFSTKAIALICASPTSIKQQQALRNYPANSPANIDGGGLPAGATGYQAIPIQTISGALGYSHVFSPTFFSETILSQQWQRMYVQGNEASLGNYEAQLGLPNNFGQIGFPCDRLQSDHALWRLAVELRHEPDARHCRREHEQESGANISSRLAAATGTSGSPISRTVRRTRSLSPIWQPLFTTRQRAPTTAPRPTPVTRTRISSSARRAPTPRTRTRPSTSTRLQEYRLYLQDNYRVSSRSDSQCRRPLGDASCTPRRQRQFHDFRPEERRAGSSEAAVDYIDNGFTTQALVTNLQNLGVKFETPQQGGLPSTGFYNSMGNFLPAPRHSPTLRRSAPRAWSFAAATASTSIPCRSVTPSAI